MSPEAVQVKESLCATLVLVTVHGQVSQKAKVKESKILYNAAMPSGSYHIVHWQRSTSI